MGENLSAFIADGIEFIVGGTLFLLSVTYLLFAIGWGPMEDLPPLKDLSTAGVTLLLAVVAYAAGVLVEAVSRMIFERQLDRKTVRRKAFWVMPLALDPSELPQVTSKSWWWALLHPKQWRGREWKLRKLLLGSGTPWVNNKPGKPASALRRAKWTPFTNQHLATTVFLREYQRAYVMKAAKGGLADEITSQLKRLRLERVSFTAAAIVLVGFLFDHRWLAAVLWGGVVLLILFIVRQRLDRYCNAIARGFVASQTLGDSKPVLVPASADEAQATA